MTAIPGKCWNYFSERFCKPGKIYELSDSQDSLVCLPEECLKFEATKSLEVIKWNGKK